VLNAKELIPMTTPQQPPQPDRRALLIASLLWCLLLLVLASYGCRTGRHAQTTTVTVDTTLRETIAVSLPVLPHQLEGTVPINQLYTLAPGDSLTVTDTTGPATGNIVVTWSGEQLGIVARVDSFWIWDTIYRTQTIRLQADCPPAFSPASRKEDTEAAPVKAKKNTSWWRGVGRSWLLVLILMPWSLLIRGGLLLYRGFKQKPPTTNYPTP